MREIFTPTLDAPCPPSQCEAVVASRSHERDIDWRKPIGRSLIAAGSVALGAEHLLKVFLLLLVKHIAELA